MFDGLYSVIETVNAPHWEVARICLCLPEKGREGFATAQAICDEHNAAVEARNANVQK